MLRQATQNLITALYPRLSHEDELVLRDELRREHALSTNATLLLYAVMQEELFDTTKSFLT